MRKKNLLLLILILTACTPLPPSSPALPHQEKSLTVCMSEEPDSLYRWGTDSIAAEHVLQTIYDGLDNGMDQINYSYQPVILEKIPGFANGDVVINKIAVQEGDTIIDAGGYPVKLTRGLPIRPAGCRSFDCAVEFDGTPVEMDQMVVTFRLKESLTWSDGVPLTADDSVYSFELKAGPDTPGTETVNYTARYEALDEHTVVWTGLPGRLNSAFYANFYLPMPRHLWEKELGYKAHDLLSAEESTRKPIGWGPFVIKEWIPGDHITVEKNPLYFRAGEGLPRLDRIVFRFVKDPQTVIADLLSGKCDIATRDIALEEQSPQLLELEKDKSLTPLFVTSTSWEHLDFGIVPVSTYNRPNFFGDLRVRQAVAHCLNRQEAVDTFLYRKSIVPSSYVPPEHPLYAGDDLTYYEYDPIKSKSLLAQVGWIDADNDGILEAHNVTGIPDGTRFEVKWQSTATPLRLEYTELFQKQLAECGIKANLEMLSPNQLFADGPEGPLFGRRFDLSSFAWLTGIEPVCETYLTAAIPNKETGWGGQNDTGFSNAQYDVACNRARLAWPGSEDYLQGHQDAQKIFSEQLPALPLFRRLRIAACRPEISGLILDPAENSELWNVENFDINR